MLESALNAVIIASSFILTFVQFSESDENRRTENAKRQLESAKRRLEEKLPLEGPVKKDPYDKLVSHPPAKYTFARWGLFVALALSLLLHIGILTCSCVDELIVSIFVAAFIVFLFYLGYQWHEEGKKTDGFLEECRRWEQTYETSRNIEAELKKKAHPQ